jgi:hypothetical protein
LDIHGLNKPTRISTGRNVHLLGEQSRTKGNPHPNQQSKMRLIQKIGEIILSIWLRELDDEQIGNAVLLSYIEEAKSKVWINAETGIAMELAIKENEKKADLPVEKLIPEDLHDFLDVFDNKANRFPESNVWDHKIDMKEGFEPKSFKNYNLTPEEWKELDKFLDEHLEKGYIRPSQSPQVSPFFFVKKKDGRLRPCQDYRYLNDWTIKNAYPLFLISEIMDKLKGAKYFSKFDVWWGYNNVQIRSGDE